MGLRRLVCIRFCSDRAEYKSRASFLLHFEGGGLSLSNARAVTGNIQNYPDLPVLRQVEDLQPPATLTETVTLLQGVNWSNEEGSLCVDQ